MFEDNFQDGYKAGIQTAKNIIQTHEGRDPWADFLLALLFERISQRSILPPTLEEWNEDR